MSEIQTYFKILNIKYLGCFDRKILCKIIFIVRFYIKLFYKYYINV